MYGVLRTHPGSSASCTFAGPTSFVPPTARSTFKPKINSGEIGSSRTTTEHCRLIAASTPDVQMSSIIHGFRQQEGMGRLDTGLYLAVVRSIYPCFHITTRVFSVQGLLPGLTVAFQRDIRCYGVVLPFLKQSLVFAAAVLRMDNPFILYRARSKPPTEMGRSYPQGLE